MPKSFTRAPARLLVLAVALGGPVAVAESANAAGAFVPTDPTAVTAELGPAPGDVLVDWEASELTDADEPEETLDEEERIDGYNVRLVDEDGGTVSSTYVPVIDPDTEELAATEATLFAEESGTYTAEVQAEEVDGDTSGYVESNAVEVYRLAPVTGVERTLSKGTVDVSWTAPVVPEGKPAVTSYDVLLLNPDGNTETEAVVEDGSTTATLTDVRTGTYTVVIFANDAAEDSSSVTTEAFEIEGYSSPDGAVIGFAQQVSGEGGRVVVGFEPGEERGFEVTGYDVVLFDREQGPVGPVLRSMEGPTSAQVSPPLVQEVLPDEDTSATFTDVPVGSYLAVVFTEYVDDSGHTQYAEPAEESTKRLDVVEVPGKVQNLTATKTSASSVRLSWNAPVAKDGVTVTKYRIGASGIDAGGYFDVPATTTSYDFTGLEAGEYRFGVTAMVQDELGGDFVDAGLVVIDKPAPAAPTKGAPVVKAKGGNVDSGEKATIAGTAPKGSVLQLQQRQVTSSGRTTADGFTVLGKTRANKKGQYSFKQKFSRNVEVRVVNLTTGAVSPSSIVEVDKDLSLKAKRAGARTYRLSGKVAPGGAGQVVKVLVKQGSGDFVQVGQATTNKKGAYTFKHSFASKGKAVVKVVSDASSTNSAGSETRTVRVR